MKKMVTVVLALMMCAALAACSGGSEADKAYEGWAKDVGPKLSEASETYQAKAAEVVEGDLETAKAIMDEYLAVLRPGIEELAAIDMSQLTGKYKDEAPAQLQALEDTLQQYEAVMATYEEQLGY